MDDIERIPETTAEFLDYLERLYGPRPFHLHDDPNVVQWRNAQAFLVVELKERWAQQMERDRGVPDQGQETIASDSRRG